MIPGALVLGAITLIALFAPPSKPSTDTQKGDLILDCGGHEAGLYKSPKDYDNSNTSTMFVAPMGAKVKRLAYPAGCEFNCAKVEIIEGPARGRTGYGDNGCIIER
jgi:hypothetical protein